jgi:hypothetical protein
MVGEVNFPRQKMRHWVLVVACVGLLVGQTSLGVQAAEQKHSRIQLSDKKLTDEEFYKLLNKKLGNNYESLQVTISACNSGGFAHKDFVKPHLQGTWSVTAARDVERGMSVEAVTKEERQKDYTENRKVAGLKIGKLDGVDLYWYSYPPAYAKTILDKPAITFKELAEKATDNDVFLPTGEPVRYAESDANVGKRTLRSGTKSNHAIVYLPYREKQTDYIAPKTIEALEAAGYKIDNDPKKSEIDFLYGSSKVGEKIGKEAGKEKKVTRGATYADFEAALDDLNKKLTENPDNKGKESGFIYIWTHGEAEQRSDLRQPGSSPGLPGQGLVVAQNTMLTLTLDDAFLSNLYEEVLVDDPGITRTASPQFLLTTVDASLSGPVEVLIGGISIGYLSPSSDRYGNYEIDLDDDLLVALWSQSSGGGVGIRFNFVSEGDYFRLATADDYLLDPEFPYDRYGFGLTSGFQVAVDADGEGDTMDLPNVDEPRGKCIGNPDYDPAVDLDGDGCITELDLSPINTPVIHPIDVSPPSQLE